MTRISIKGADRLYPRDIDWRIEPGINAVIGGTGLGKTTLLYSLQFAVFGKLVVDAAERIERDFFKERLSTRSAQKLLADPPVVHVEFSAGGSDFVVKRNLLSGTLLEITSAGKPVKPNRYEETLCAAVGLPGDFPGLTRLQGSLLFFGEGRYLLAWDNQAQHELINLMMSDHASYVKLGKLWELAESADSAARNLSSQAVRLEKDLARLKKAESPVDQLARRSEETRFARSHAELEAELATIRTAIARETKLEAAQATKITTAYEDFHKELEHMESTVSTDLDDNLLAVALASPTVASIRQSLAEFYVAPDTRGCPCCGRPGIAQAVASLAKAAAANARAGHCIACSKDLPKPAPQPARARLADPSTSTGAKAQALQALLFQREQTRSRLADLQEKESTAFKALADSSEAQLKHLKEHPVSVEETMQITIKGMREREAVARAACSRHVAQLKQELKKTNAVFNQIQTKIAAAFGKYASLYLDETCTVKFLQDADVPVKRGPQIKAPHAAFFPVISGQVRKSPSALSDAQRSFIDLAFRMAVLDAWHQRTGKTATMIIETPEGAVDVAYMERVASMIRAFGQQGHTLLISTNLNNEIFLPEIMAARPKADRRRHTLNLLAEGRPRQVQIDHQAHFDRILSLMDKNAVRS